MTAMFEEIAPGSIGPAVFADAVSPDGSVVVGYDRPDGAFEWTQSAGLVLLKDASGNVVHGEATGVSKDGSVIVGTVGGAGLALTNDAFRWTSSGGAVTIEPSAFRVTANAVSEDGTIIAGDYKSTQTGYTSPYVLTNGSLAIIPTENQDGVTDTYDNTMSANGAVIAGTFTTEKSGGVYAWFDDQFVPLGGAGASSATATAVSEDGSTVVGQLGDGAALGSEVAFFWDPATTSVATNLALPSGFNDSTAAGVSNKGATIVGWMAPSNELMADTTSTAFIWNQATDKTQSLQQYLTSEGLGSSLTGWKLTEATAITPDGNTIVGMGIDPHGRQESWIATNLNPTTPTPTSPTPTSPTPTSPTPTSPTPTSPRPTSPTPTPTSPPPTKPPTGPTSAPHRTKTALTAKPRPANFGQTVTFTVTVTSIGHGGGTPTGDITFLDGTTVRDTVVLKGGKARFSTSTLTVGLHWIRAVYVATGNFENSNSGTVNEKIKAGRSKSMLARSEIIVQPPGNKSS